MAIGLKRKEIRSVIEFPAFFGMTGKSLGNLIRSPKRDGENAGNQTFSFRPS